MNPTETKPHVVTVANCPDCHLDVSDDWRLRGLRVRGELRRHKILDNEMRIVEVILDKTFGWGLPSVVIPELKYFTALTGMAEPHVHKAIAGLHLARVIRVVRVRGQLTYSVREDSENWQVRPRVARETIHQTVNLIREFNDLPPLPSGKGALPNFKDGPDAKNFASPITENVMTAGITEELLPSLI